MGRNISFRIEEHKRWLHRHTCDDDNPLKTIEGYFLHLSRHLSRIFCALCSPRVPPTHQQVSILNSPDPNHTYTLALIRNSSDSGSSHLGIHQPLRVRTRIDGRDCAEIAKEVTLGVVRPRLPAVICVDANSLDKQELGAWARGIHECCRQYDV